ncbi:hypothetical protein [Sinorhizobium meliloti]|uniref:hypothetical protein n=1 Tax=Rhizobium meliloti TaxID=382 RepID=UPI0001E4EA4E|nr:hypothetical protein [Sinorhizobium meliloti]AEG55480.1 hypothetical protein Sinme_3778 [Sinorhizobium meliloti AK83]ARS68976.1 hypothetical protein SMRU11_18195 [Sinorhizobium meliloti RU11/001]ASP69326.1 hypothetical protein CDO29_34065 [Sinorhizobium meliloti]ASP81783.1 hypothetical protein CDO27_28670 [Sinorhizobium meliloti]KKA14739.1 hypothetical protein VP03_07205 [Sinorhizobium meliloti]
MPVYQRLPVRPVPGAMVVKLYHSGDAVRGYVRKVTDPSEDDVIFPGEEMEAESAFRLAASHSEGSIPIYVELVEDVEWDSSWGTLTD